MVLIRISLVDGYRYKEATESGVPSGFPLRSINVTNDHGNVSFVVITILFFPHSWGITGFVIRGARRVTLVEQE